jgi:16S rRNA C1402 N4-methylase RsmH
MFLPAASSAMRLRREKREVEILTRKPIDGERMEELAENPRARSAKLRACLKLN